MVSLSRIKNLMPFLLGGGLAGSLNLLVISIMIQQFGFDTNLLRNVANVVAIDISLLCSFFIYRVWVWAGGSWQFWDVLLRQIPLYHISNMASVSVRILLLFPILDLLGVGFVLNTIVGIILSASINYLFSDRLFYHTRNSNSRSNDTDATSLTLHYPEGLAACPVTLC